MAVRTRRSALTLVLLSALVAAGLSAAPAGAAVTYTYDAGAAKVSVLLSATQDQAQVRRSGSAIGLRTGSTFTACGAATVTNTNQIVVTATGPGLQSLVISLEGGRFQPGKTHEATGVSEIEFVVNLGPARTQSWSTAVPSPTTFGSVQEGPI